MGMPQHAPVPAATPKSFEKVDNALFIVHATVKQKRVLKVDRNMIVVRTNKRDLALINPIRLTENGERKLKRLGRIRRVVQLSFKQANAAAYYKEKFKASLWSPELYTQAQTDVDDKSAELPLPEAQVFLFQHTTYPEAAIVLEKEEGNILITSTAMQHQSDNPFVNTPARTWMQIKGMTEDLVAISPGWLKAVSPKSGDLREDFEELLRLEFSRMIGASGTLLPVQAKEASVIAVERAFPIWY